eukprot:2805637-Pyramimonas_sp.AAC.1
MPVLSSPPPSPYTVPSRAYLDEGVGVHVRLVANGGGSRAQYCKRHPIVRAREVALGQQHVCRVALRLDLHLNTQGAGGEFVSVLGEPYTQTHMGTHMGLEHGTRARAEVRRYLSWEPGIDMGLIRIGRKECGGLPRCVRPRLHSCGA